MSSNYSVKRTAIPLRGLSAAYLRRYTSKRGIKWPKIKSRQRRHQGQHQSRHPLRSQKAEIVVLANVLATLGTRSRAV